MNLHSKDLAEQKLQELRKIFPEIFEDGMINYDKFKTILGENVDEKSEHYSFNWSGKKECYKTIKAKTNATLKVDTDNTILDGDNVFIEGDNLEVLKLLQNSYHKKIKMIYIDPPYNKDKDFVYKDTWGDSIKNYMAQTDQLTDEGYTSTKTSSTGRRHTNWLNMIYPRLWLSRNLLKDDGVIFVSIDDDEVHNLRKVMDEIYGEENFIAQILWQKRTAPDMRTTFSEAHEFILLYGKTDKSSQVFNKLSLTEEQKRRYKNPDNDERGLWVSSDFMAKGTRPNQLYGITTPSGKIYYPLEGKCWQNIESEFLKQQNEKRFYYGVNGDSVPRRKNYLCENKGRIPWTWWTNSEVGHSQEGKLEVNKIFNGKEVFSTPKPIRLIKRMLEIATDENSIILDFFAGSGATAHAVMDLNAEDGGDRKYILVQLPEATDEKSEAYKAGYKKISDITKARIKKVIDNLNYKDGFKSYYLDNSNFQMFKELKKRPNDSLEEIENMLKMSVFQENILTQGAKELDLVYEVGLKNGFTLSAKTERVSSVPMQEHGNEGESIESGVYNFIKLHEEQREFYFCFNKEIKNDIIHHLPKEAKLICYEKALGDSVKLNLHSNLDLETL